MLVLFEIGCAKGRDKADGEVTLVKGDRVALLEELRHPEGPLFDGYDKPLPEALQGIGRSPYRRGRQCGACIELCRLGDDLGSLYNRLRHAPFHLEEGRLPGSLRPRDSLRAAGRLLQNGKFGENILHGGHRLQGGQPEQSSFEDPLGRVGTAHSQLSLVQPLEKTM